MNFLKNRFTVYAVVFLLLVAAGCRQSSTDEADVSGTDFEPEPLERSMADENDPDLSEVNAADTPVGNLINIPIETVQINDFVYMATGLANTYMIVTDEGNVLVDTGFAFQADNQRRLLRRIDDGPITHILIPQGQHDDIGGLKRWRDKNTEVMMTRSTVKYMKWREDVSPWLWDRFAVLYDWSRALLSVQEKLYPYNPIEPDIIIEEYQDYEFEQGGVRFAAFALPGAEGANSAGLWLPDYGILFCGGGFVGPEFPMWPNFGTVRGDRGRQVDTYLESLNRILELEPEVMLPGQGPAIVGASRIRTDLTLIRDAVSFVRDEVIDGLNDGKAIYQLMEEIKLPEELSHLSQTHGRVDWTIRNMVYEYGGWFQYRYTSELYPTPVSDIYQDIVALTGTESLIQQARLRLDRGEYEEALLLAEIVLDTEPENTAALETYNRILIKLLIRARETTATFSEIAWLETLIQETEKKLD